MKIKLLGTALFLCLAALGIVLLFPNRTVRISGTESATPTSTAAPVATASSVPALNMLRVIQNTADYDVKLREIANLRVITHVKAIKRTSTTLAMTITTTSTIPIGWPAKTVYPNAGALLPFSRIVAYYGNFYSTQMGILGEYPATKVLQMLASTTAEWQMADPTTPVIPAIEYIAVTAQASPGADGKYRARMPGSQIEKAIQMAAQINGVVILDVQVGLSNVQAELPLLADYLKLPQVELALDPEFAMYGGKRPGTVIGTMDATTINYAANFLANLVRENNLPPKILIVHRFTQPMVTNYKNITPLPEVQIVMDMDGFGSQAKKLSSYQDFIQAEPVEFTGIKLFFKNDARADHLMTPAEVLKLSPQPIYVQYQ